MEEKFYSDCELKYIREEGYEPSKAAEICAKEQAAHSAEETGESSRDVGEEYWWE